MIRAGRFRAGVSAVVVGLVLLVGCGGDDEASGDDTTTTVSEETSSSEEGGSTESTDAGSEAESPYAGHTSEVYDDDASWICRPDLADDVCRDLDVTVVAADGTTTVEEREPAADPPVDCFYVYPTVSEDPGPVADLEWTPEDAEALTVVAQAAQYAQQCRLFAPVYRQVTLSGLGTASQDDRAVAYADVLDAWQTYVERWNDGRGVILIGHSQGTGHLTRLISEEIDGAPALQDRLVAAHLFGGSVQVAEGEDVGGDFQEIPVCTSADEAGCIVSYSSYPADAPPDADGIFGRAADGDRAICVDPVALLDGSSGNAVVPVEAPLIGSGTALDDVDVTTPFLALPGATQVSCEATADHDYLAVATADDARPLDGLTTETLGHTWGLHLVDVNVVLDDLVALAGRQAEAYGEG